MVGGPYVFHQEGVETESSITMFDTSSITMFDTFPSFANAHFTTVTE